MKMSVVVVAHNEGDELPATVKAFGETGPDDIEIVVVDDQSDDGSPDAVEARDGLRVLRTPERAGVTGSRNFGAAHAHGDVIVFSDGHVRPQPGWAEPLIRELSDSAVGAVAPMISPLGQHGQPGYGFTWRSPSLATAWISRAPSAPQPTPLLCGCFFVIRRDVFDRLGGFDPGLTLWGMEDADLSLCVWRLGLECRVVPDSEIRHLFRKNFPYQVAWVGTVHNTLRVAAAHFGATAAARVLGHYAPQPGFADAAERLVMSDVFERREWLDERTTRDADWFIDHFRIDALR
jgi:GT2 family glycosyltransferase